MKLYLRSILKSLCLTAGLDGALLLLIYLLSPAVMLEIGQAALLCAVILLLAVAVCLYGRIPVRRRRELWYCLAVSLPLHTVASVVSVLIYGNRLSGYWPGSMDLAWLVLLVLILSAWGLSVCAITLSRHARMSEARREENRRIQKASRGLRPEITSVSPARARLITVLKGAAWTLGFYTLTGLLLDLLKELSIADTLLAYAAFPCLWCGMAAAFGRAIPSARRGAFTLSVSLTNILLCTAVMVFLIPSNVTRHVGYALLYLDGVLTNPFGHPEQLLVIAEFLLVWVTVAACGIGRRKK